MSYLLPGVHAADALADPRLARLRRACARWTAIPHPDGALLVPTPETGAARPPTIRAWRDTDDGLRYGTPDPLPTIGDLARRHCPPCTDVDLVCGASVSLALGAAAPRRIRLAATSIRLDEYATPLGTLSHHLRCRTVAGESVPDEETARLIFLALQACYHLTEEMADDLALLTTADLIPCLVAVWGGDPKAAAGGGPISQQPPPASSAIPSCVPLNSNPSPTTPKNALP
jgi:hypothetical protein